MSKTRFIFDLPVDIRIELCDMIDASDQAEKLGSYMHADNITLCLITSAGQRGKSPAREVINHWIKRGVTVNQLFIALAKMRYVHGMSILLPYVDSKYHKYMQIGKASSVSSENKVHPMSSVKSVGDLPIPSFSDEVSLPKPALQNLSNQSKSSVQTVKDLPNPPMPSDSLLTKSVRNASPLPKNNCDYPVVMDKKQSVLPVKEMCDLPKPPVPDESCLPKPPFKSIGSSPVGTDEKQSKSSVTNISDLPKPPVSDESCLPTPLFKMSRSSQDETGNPLKSPVIEDRNLRKPLVPNESCLISIKSDVEG